MTDTWQQMPNVVVTIEFAGLWQAEPPVTHLLRFTIPATQHGCDLIAQVAPHVPPTATWTAKPVLIAVPD